MELAKKHHPDSSQEDDSSTKFQTVSLYITNINFQVLHKSSIKCVCVVCYKIENAYRILKEKFSFDRQRSALTANLDKDISNNSQDPEQSLEHNIEVFYL